MPVATCRRLPVLVELRITRLPKYSALVNRSEVCASTRVAPPATRDGIPVILPPLSVASAGNHTSTAFAPPSAPRILVWHSLCEIRLRRSESTPSDMLRSLDVVIAGVEYPLMVTRLAFLIASRSEVSPKACLYAFQSFTDSESGTPVCEDHCDSV